MKKLPEMFEVFCLAKKISHGVRTKVRIWLSGTIKFRSVIKHHFVFPWRKMAADCVLRDMMKEKT